MATKSMRFILILCRWFLRGFGYRHPGFALTFPFLLQLVHSISQKCEESGLLATITKEDNHFEFKFGLLEKSISYLEFCLFPHSHSYSNYCLETKLLVSK